MLLSSVNDQSLAQPQAHSTHGIPPVLPTLTPRDHQSQVQSIDGKPSVHSNTRPENWSSLNQSQLTPETPLETGDMTPLLPATEDIISSLDNNYYRLTSPTISPSSSDYEAAHSGSRYPLTSATLFENLFSRLGGLPYNTIAIQHFSSSAL